MKTLFEAPDAKFRFDEANSIFEFTWVGTVSEKSAVRVLTLASQAAEEMEVVHWLSDRSKLEGYDGGARIWIKNDFVKSTGKKMLAKIDKIAVLSSENPMAQLASGVLSQVIREKNPNIQGKEFDYSGAAMNWLKGIVPQEEEPKKKKGLFRRG